MAQPTKLVILDFWAEWCGPCKLMHPIIDELKQEYGDKIEVREINVDEPQNSALVEQYAVMSIPTYIFVKNDDAVDHAIGAQSKEIFKKKIENLLQQ